MRKLTFFLEVLLAALLIHLEIDAQDRIPIASQKGLQFSPLINVNNNPCPEFSNGDLDSILILKFRSILSASENTQPGTFAGLDLKETKVVFNTVQTFKKGSFLTGNVNASVKDGLSSIFNNSTLNTGVGINLSYNHLIRIGSTKAFCDDMLWYDLQINRINREYSIDSINVKKIISELLQKRTNLEYQIDSLNKKKAGSNINDESEQIFVTILSKQSTLDSVNYILNTNYHKAYKKGRDTTLAKKHNALIQKMSSKLPGYTIVWFSLNGGLENRAFKLLNTDTGFGYKTKSTTYLDLNFGISFNIYSYSKAPFRTFYMRVTPEVVLSDNLSELDEVKLIETNTVFNDTVTGVITNSKNEYSAYLSNGTYRKDLLSAKISFDAYYFMFKGNIIALHLFPKVLLSNKSPVYNGGIGLLYSFKDKKDNSRVNVEAYFDFRDWFNSSNKNNQFFERNDFGLRFAFPISF